MRNLTILISAALCGVATSALAQPQAAPAAATQQSADARLKVLYEAYSNWDQKESGYFEDSKGENQAAAYLAKVDPATQLARARFEQQMLDQLNAIPTSSLSPDERVNAGVLRAILEAAVADAKFRDWEMPANSDSNFWTYLNERDPLDDAAAYQRYIGRMRDIPRYFDQQIANMRAGLKTRLHRPRAMLDGRDVSIASFIKSPQSKATSTRRSRQCPRRSPRPSRKSCAPTARARSDQAVIPAYAKLLKFFRDDYLPHARKTPRPKRLPRRQGVLSASRSTNTRRSISTRGDPRDRPQGSRAHRCRDAGDDEGDRFQGRFPRVPEIPAHRSAVLSRRRRTSC